jgi:hypothetical protein
MSARDLQRLEAGIRQAHKQGDIKTVDVLGAELRRIQQMPMPKQAPVKKAPPKRSLFGAAIEAIPNIPSSAAEFATGLYTAVTNPIETAGTLLDIAAGGLKTGAQKALPKNVYNFINELDRDPKSADRAVRAARQFGGQMADRYGTRDAIYNTLATDPVGFAADMSTLLSGGAGAVRAGGKVVSKVAPKAAPKIERVANAMTRAADATNPINVRPVRAVGRAVAKAAERAPLKITNALAPKSAAYMEAAEGRAPELIAQLRAPGEIVPGSKPTAAQQASPLGLTKFAAMGEASAKAKPSEYLARANEAEAARLASLRTVGKTPADRTAAVNARKAATDPLYAAAETQKFRADPQLMQLADDPYIKQAMPDAARLSASKGVTFENNPTRYIHNVKISLDKMLSKTGDTALAATERAQVGNIKTQLVNWLESKAPDYKTARTTFAEKSKPINQMDVGQYLESKLNAPLEGGAERAGAFATAVRDAPGTLKRATTGEARYKELTDVLTPEQAGVVNAIRDDLNRVQTTKTQAQKGASAAPRISQLASQIGDMPALLNRAATIANTIFNRLQGQIDHKLAIEIATEMLDPKVVAAAIEKAATRERRATATGRITGATARGTGKVLGSTAAKVGAQTQNIMTQAQNQNAMNNIYGISEFPDFDPETGEPLIDIDYSEGYPVPIYGRVSRNMMRR